MNEIPFSKKLPSQWKIGIIGVGIVGGPIKQWFEGRGYVRGKNLFCYDTDPTKGHFDDVNQADILFIAVPTPSNPDGSCNSSVVESVISGIEGEKILVIKSTVVPGTTESLQKKFPQHRLVYNPEFLTESQAWADFIHPDRQIIGYTARSKQISGELLSLLPLAYWSSPSFFGSYEKNEVSATGAELGKYACNVFGAMKVAYCNILADLCYAFTLLDPSLNLSYQSVRRVLAGDGRIGGAWTDVEHGSYSGFGGFCFPKDLQALIQKVKSLIGEIEKNVAPELQQGTIAILQKGLAVLQALWDYNEALLAWQNLTVEDVSRHDQEIVLQKRKPIRTSG